MFEVVWEWLSDQDRQRTLAFIGGGLMAVVVGGWQLYLHLQPNKEKPGNAASQTISAGQVDVSGVIVGPGGVVGSIQIQQGDSEHVRKQKLERAQALLSAEVVANLRALDRRLALVEAADQSDTFDARLSEVRRQIAPAADADFSEGYRRLSASSQAASLRHALNGERLRSDAPGPLLQVLLDAGVAGEPVQRFHAALVEAEQATDSLLEAIENRGQSSLDDEAARHNAELEILARKLVHNRTRLAYLSGLRLLDMLGAPADLSSIGLLDPRRPLPAPEYIAQLAPLVEEGERLVEKRRDLLRRAGELRDLKLEEYRQLEEELKINPADTWAVVVGKARALRDLGRTGEAVGAFARYAEMFGAADPGAVAYAHTAQQFTTQLRALGVRGGGYVFDVKNGGTAARAGLEVGDIIISYAGEPTPGPKELSDDLSRFTAADQVRIDYVRLQPAGEFTLKTVSLPGGPLGAGLMPI